MKSPICITLGVLIVLIFASFDLAAQTRCQPAIDAAIAKGIADPDRIAVIGQSNGGFRPRERVGLMAANRDLVKGNNGAQKSVVNSDRITGLFKINRISC